MDVPGLPTHRIVAIALAALACGAGAVVLILTSDRDDATTAWAIFGPVIGWSFIFTGLYAWRRPKTRAGQKTPKEAGSEDFALAGRS